MIGGTINNGGGEGGGEKRGTEEMSCFLSLPSLPVPSAGVSPLAPVSPPPHDLPLGLRVWSESCTLLSSGWSGSSGPPRGTVSAMSKKAISKNKTKNRVGNGVGVKTAKHFISFGGIGKALY